MAEKLEDVLFALEERFWLGGADYYRGNLADAALMVFPDPAGVQIKDEILRRMPRARIGMERVYDMGGNLQGLYPNHTHSVE